MNSSDTSLARRGSSQIPKQPAMSTAAREQREVFAGLVERVTFHNPDNGFCVLRVKARGTARPGHRGWPRAGDQRRRIRSGHRYLDQRPHARTSVQGELPARGTAHDARGDREVPRLGHDQRDRPHLRRTAGAGVRRGGVRRHRGAARAAPAGRGHRPQARREDRRWVGRSEGDPRDHDLPALARCQHVALGAHLQDLRRRRHPGALGEPLPPRP